jgi:YD repeat-containing protein
MNFKQRIMLCCLFTIAWAVSHDMHAQADASVDHHTGSPLVSVPLTVINDRSLRHPIAISYSTNGVKVDDTGGDVGTDWMLQAEGSVTRVLRGLPDDYTSSDANDLRRGWLYNSLASTVGNFSYPADGSGPASCNPSTFYNFLNNFNHVADTEPDEFRFSAPGLAGTFMFDNTGAITSILTNPYMDVRIEAIRAYANAPINTFRITTPGGLVYVFNEIESVDRQTTPAAGSDLLHLRREYNYYATKLTYTAAWKLSSVESPMGEKIQLTYVTQQESAEIPVKLGVWVSSSSTPVEKLQYTIQETRQAKKLSRVSSPHQEVVFTRWYNPIAAYYKELKEVVINELTPGGTVWVKTFQFTYGTCPKDADPTVESTSFDRKFLSTVRIITPCEYLPPYEFTYHGFVSGTGRIAIPMPGSWKQDVFGYPKDFSPSTPYPAVYINPSLTGVARMSVFRQPTPPANEVIVPGADRTPSGTPLGGALMKIRHPGGASDEFEYESHQFYNPVTQTTMSGGGIRLKKITSRDGISSVAQERSFTYNTGTLLAMPSFAFLSGYYKHPTSGAVWTYSSSDTDRWKKLTLRTPTNINADFDENSTVVYENVTERMSTGKGKTVYAFTAPYAYGASADAGTGWSPTYQHVAASTACPNIGEIQAGYYQSPFIRQTPAGFRRGEIVSVSVYEESNAVNPVEITEYTYQDKSINNATVKSLWYDFIPYSTTHYFFVAGVTATPLNTKRVLLSVRTRTRDRVSPTSYLENLVTYTYGSNHARPISQSSTGSEGTVTTERYRYAIDYGQPQAASADTQVQMIDALNTAGRTGELIESATFVTPAGGTEKAVGGALVVFGTAGTSPVRVLPVAARVLDTGDGITGFTMSAVTGSGASRTFSSHAAYLTVANTVHAGNGDVIRQEGTQRTFQSFHTDALTGVVIATIAQAEAASVVYSNFDQQTDYDFDVYGFSASEKTAVGYHATVGLGNFTSESTRYLSHAFERVSGNQYKFMARYRPAVTTGTHTFSLVIKDTNGVTKASATLPFTISSGLTWYVAEIPVDLSSAGTNSLVAEVRFTGTATTGGTLDEVLLAPTEALIQRQSFHAAFGVLSVTDVAGRTMQYQRDAGGRLLQIRDDAQNIRQKTEYFRWRGDSWSGENMSLNIDVPLDDIVVSTPTTFKAKTGCSDVSTIEWKVTPTSNPSGGTFTAGLSSFNYTFGAAGDYLVILRTYHSTYGYMEKTVTVNVKPQPLTVSICLEGPTNVNLCSDQSTFFHECTGAPAEVTDNPVTTFTVSASGCTSGTYTYQWMRRRVGSTYWVPLSTLLTTTYAGDNTESYEVKCVVTSSCGFTGESAIKTVTVYVSPVNCDGVMH